MRPHELIVPVKMMEPPPRPTRVWQDASCQKILYNVSYLMPTITDTNLNQCLSGMGLQKGAQPGIVNLTRIWQIAPHEDQIH